MAFLVAAPALADDGSMNLHRLFIMWFPLVIIIGIWIYMMRRAGLGKVKEVQERTIRHMDALEAKLDQVIDLLQHAHSRD